MLLLGISSYSTSIYNYKKFQIINNFIKKLLNDVHKNNLTQMDASDFSRCKYLQLLYNCQVYSISMQKGTDYCNNHVYENFNKRNFTNKLFKQFGQNIYFNQIILN